MDERVKPDGQNPDPTVAEKKEILVRFFSTSFPEPEYAQAPLATRLSRYPHGLEIFRDGKKVHTVYIDSEMMNDRHPTPKELAESLATMDIAKQITQTDTFKLDHKSLGTGSVRW
jgi:hypothetical protein